MSKKTASNNNELQEIHDDAKDDEFNINLLTIPTYVSHMKPGNTLCTNNNLFVLQDGSTTLEIRVPPKFESKKIPWRDGLIRDIVWCSELHVFVLLTQKSLFTFDPQALTTQSTMDPSVDIQLNVKAYSKIKPIDDKHSFWRCACVGRTIFIAYSGFGTTIDEYIIGPSSCRLIKRWLPPMTCAEHEGIWCIRYQPDSNQIGMTIMDGQTNQWRFEIRNTRSLSIVWQIVLPIVHGDCELSALKNEEWLIINSCGIRLVHIANRKIQAAVEYERELRNGVTIGENYFVIRTKNTLEIHLIKKKEKF